MKNNILLLFIIQIILSFLLLYEDIFLVAAVFYMLIDILLFSYLITKKSDLKTFYVLIVLFVSIINLFLVYSKSDLILISSIGQALLFLLSAILLFERKIYKETLPKPIKSSVYYDDVDHSKYESSQKNNREEFDKSLKVEREFNKRFESLDSEKIDSEKKFFTDSKFDDLRHIEKKDVKSSFSEKKDDFDRIYLDKIKKEASDDTKEEAKYRAKALAYELEREANELKRAERFLKKKQIENIESEIIKEAKALEDASKKAKLVERALKEEELNREAKELLEAERQIKEIDFLNKQQELNRKAISQVKEIINKQKSERSKPKSKKSVIEKTKKKKK
ncbi:MAG: hypothetical protein KatS3mg002_1405 [Candidatus Woesearchaeota archaeon]|nr:MAG: hypothetical protein KatS3mg002_1405 [Candidatus Woesearchaeota archaeon]